VKKCDGVKRKHDGRVKESVGEREGVKGNVDDKFGSEKKSETSDMCSQK
jgi:hypothetical protein